MAKIKMSIDTKTKAEVVEALKCIPYAKLAAAINRKHLNGALREIPRIEFGELPRGPAEEILGASSDCKLKSGAAKEAGGRLKFWHRYRVEKITLDLDALGDRMIAQKGAFPITAILIHELIHALQAQNGYSLAHNKAFEACCLFACHSGLRVVGGVGRLQYAPEYGFSCVKLADGFVLIREDLADQRPDMWMPPLFTRSSDKRSTMLVKEE